MNPTIKVKKLHKDAILPEYMSEGAGGFDIHALEQVLVYPNGTVLIRTGLAFEIPKGYVLDIRPRSGLSLKTKLRVANSPGTIDSDYRGEIKIILDNIYDRVEGKSGAVNILKGDRIAQGILVPVLKAEFKEVEELSETKRGEGGFGHSG